LMVKATVRWTHLGHGRCGSSEDRVPCSRDETLIDRVLHEINDRLAFTSEEEYPYDQAEEDVVRELHEWGFEVEEVKHPPAIALVEAEPGKRYYCVKWSPRDTDVPAIHPMVIIATNEAPIEHARRAARMVCEQLTDSYHVKRIVAKQTERRPYKEVEELEEVRVDDKSLKDVYEDMLDAWEDGHAEVELEVTDGKMELRDIRLTDDVGCNYIEDKDYLPGQWEPHELEECLRKERMLREKLKKLLIE